MRGKLLLALSLICTTGCSSDAPDTAAVRELMTSDQLALSDPIVNSVGMVLVPIPAGEFQMGTAVEEGTLEERYEKLLQNPEIRAKLKSDGVTKADVIEHFKREQQQSAAELPQHVVKITKPFLMGSCEVTQEQYARVMGTHPWQGKPLVNEEPNSAASYVSWEDAVEFCRKLTESDNQQYRLPTEAECLTALRLRERVQLWLT